MRRAAQFGAGRRAGRWQAILTALYAAAASDVLPKLKIPEAASR